MKLAHVSDPHFSNLQGVPWLTLLRDKRITGYANFLVKRRRTHQASVARTLARRLAQSHFDHVVITGDLTNLALTPELAEAEGWLRDDLAMSPERVSIVPGNHERYTTQAASTGAFEDTLSPYLRSDRSSNEALQCFPFVRLRGPIAIIGLDTGVPRPPFVAAGEVGFAQLEALRHIFEDPEVRRRTPVLLVHHPPKWTRSWLHEMRDGLRDATALQAVLPARPGMILHGHLHRTVVESVHVGTTKWVIVGAPSASNTDARRDRVAGYNTYDFDDAGVLRSMTSTTLTLAGVTREQSLEIPSAHLCES